MLHDIDDDGRLKIFTHVTYKVYGTVDHDDKKELSLYIAVLY